MKPARRLILAITTVALSLMACKKTKPAPASTGTPSADPIFSSGPVDPNTLGTVVGTISFQGEPPQALAIDTTMDPACGVTGPQPKAEQYVVHDGKLANVYLYVKNGPSAAMNTLTPPSGPVVLDQKGCVYTPHVIAIMRGGSVEFRNDDATMHNIHTMPTMVGNDTIDISQGPHGTPQVKIFDQPEAMIPVRCNNHPWMNAFINVSSTPFFAISDPSGHFELRGLPPGKYTLGAVHEKLGEQTIQITVSPKTVTKADFSFAVK